MDGIVPAALHAKRNALMAQRDELATMFADGVLDGPAVRRESEKLSQRITGIDATLAEAVRVSAAAALLADGPGEVQRHWDAASPDIKGKVADELMVVRSTPPCADARRSTPTPSTSGRSSRPRDGRGAGSGPRGLPTGVKLGVRTSFGTSPRPAAAIRRRLGQMLGDFG